MTIQYRLLRVGAALDPQMVYVIAAEAGSVWISDGNTSATLAPKPLAEITTADLPEWVTSRNRTVTLDAPEEVQVTAGRGAFETLMELANEAYPLERRRQSDEAAGRVGSSRGVHAA